MKACPSCGLKWHGNRKRCPPFGCLTAEAPVVYMYERTCIRCGKNFMSRRPDARICSGACGQALYRKRASALPQSLYRERKTWYDMIRRCRNPKHAAFRHYGGRGIEVRYASFEAFLADVGPKPSPEHSIDRINNDGHYEPGNCRWADAKTQQKNRRAQRRRNNPKVERWLKTWESRSGAQAES
jgi:hypothetical protein